jgi:hypothetical protein
MWSDSLRLIHEEEIYDPEHGVMDMTIPVHLAQYMRDVLEGSVCFKGNKVIINGKVTIPLYFMCWLQIVVLKELFVETSELQKKVEELLATQGDLLNKNKKETRNLSEITFIRKNNEFSHKYSISKTRIEEINKNLKLLNEFKKLIKESLNTITKVDVLVQSINLINSFDEFNIKKEDLIEIISKGAE